MSPDRRREDLVRTTLRLFSERPPERVSPEDVAAAADVSRALVYRYFSDMDELRTAALRSAIDELAPRLAAPEELPPAEQVRRALRAFIAFAEGYAPAYTSLLRGGSKVATERTEALIDEVRGQVLALLAERAGAGGPSPRVRLAMRCWISAVESAVLIWIEERPMPAAELADWLLDQLLAMVGASGAGDAEAFAARHIG
ncbi:TetR/AcrR family transcriptional regulator [Nocardiopsis sp. CNT-189]|uniref:TetR/AcrR family transcriptional regulator n=1 Tax=Nocardiopsis oceanisediminis TaxID=2816862 RepID=UPI003B2BB5E7